MQKSSYRVVYILTKLELGGAQKVCLALMQGMRDHKVPATLISGTEGVLANKTKNFESVYLLPAFKREVSIKHVWQELKSFVGMIRLLSDLRKKYGQLIVHTHSTKAGIMGRWAAFFARVKIRIHTVHGYGFNERQSRFTWLCIYLCELLTSFITTHFVCVSQKDQQVGIKLFPRFAKKSSIIRAAAEWDAFCNVRNGADASFEKTFVVGTVSCFKPQKNLFDLLNAFKKVHDFFSQNSKKVLLQIIGDGVQRPSIEAWIKENKLGDAITLLGWQNDVALWMKHWNVFALSSLWEGLPIAIVEARLCKLPVVAYDVGGVGEIIKDGKNGFLLKSGDWISLADQLIKIVQDDALYNLLAMYDDNLQDFNDEVMIKNHVDLYNKMPIKNVQM